MMPSDEFGSLSASSYGRGAGSEAVRVFEVIKRNATIEMGGVLSGFWGSIEEQVRLASLAGHDYSANQDDRLAVIALQHRELELATRYRVAIECEFDQWLRPRQGQSAPKSLSLMSEDELEIHLAGQQTQELLDHQFLRPLELLDERLQALANALGVQDQGKRYNPLRPEAAVGAFTALFGSNDLTPGLRTLVFRLHDKRLPHALGTIYERTNAALEAAGFAGLMVGDASPASHKPPYAATGVRADAQSGDGEWVPDGGVVEHNGPSHQASGHAPTDTAMPQQAVYSQPPGSYSAAPVYMHNNAGRPPRYRDVVREQLRTWRARLAQAEAQVNATAALTVQANAQPSGGGHVLGTEELFSIAQLLQGDDPTPFARALAGEGDRPLAGVLREELLDGVRQLGFDPSQTALSGDEQDAIDLIGILFQSLFEANELMHNARTMYGRLVMPYLKVALTDDSMFNRRGHPARQLLDALTEACDGNTGDTAQDRETLQCAEHAVERVVDEFETDQAIFELAAAELRDQLDQQRKRSEIAEKRTAEAIHGRERLQHARRAAEDLVASRLADRRLTQAVAQFLDDQWRHYLTQTWLRDGPQSQRHHAAIAVGDAMIQVDVDAAHARGATVADQLLALQLPLGECYSSCGMDAGDARDSMARIIAALGLPDTARTVYQPQSQVGEPDAAEDEGAASALRVVGGTDTLSFDPAIAAGMRRLRVGQGLHLIDDEGHASTARVAWISPLTARLLIVNRRGMRRMVVSPEELAALVARGTVVVRSVEAPFDEAMKQLWQHLSQPLSGQSDMIAAAS
ncbi:MAG: DUF1631 family protein [Luteimonas sp.]